MSTGGIKRRERENDDEWDAHNAGFYPGDSFQLGKNRNEKRERRLSAPTGNGKQD